MNPNQQKHARDANDSDDPRQAIESGEPTIDEAGRHAQAGNETSDDVEDDAKRPDHSDGGPHWESGRQQAL